ncbi:hypothetical protein LJB99_05850 [Deltaproteobacteria bacterium OttesenSCG-928-K17]|nr:hypothetical protein [Deltaproteobacteria bacterium OttesenSCG-928-K17]
MDVKCVRVLRAYDEAKNEDGAIYVDEDARYALNKQWGEVIEVQGRRKAKLAIKPLAAMDQEGFIARASQKVIDDLFIEYGEEVFLH